MSRDRITWIALQVLAVVGGVWFAVWLFAADELGPRTAIVVLRTTASNSASVKQSAAPPKSASRNSPSDPGSKSSPRIAAMNGARKKFVSRFLGCGGAGG